MSTCGQWSTPYGVALDDGYFAGRRDPHARETCEGKVENAMGSRCTGKDREIWESRGEEIFLPLLGNGGEVGI
jgi:hypothetical protein